MSRLGEVHFELYFMKYFIDSILDTYYLLMYSLYKCRLSCLLESSVRCRTVCMEFESTYECFEWTQYWNKTLKLVFMNGGCKQLGLAGHIYLSRSIYYYLGYCQRLHIKPPTF